MIIDNFFINNGGDGKKLFVEKTPVHLYYVEEILSRYPEAKIICVIRDGRDVCVSLQKWNERTGTQGERSRKKQIILWKKAAEKYLELMSNVRLKDRILGIKYEDLKNEPGKEIEKMFRFADLEISPETISEIIQANDIKKLTMENKAVYKGSTGEWKNIFSEKDKRLFKAKANDVLLALGYSWE